MQPISVPPHLPVPRNVFFTGTVNVDETTYMFSPKVLDRAFTLEFNSVDLAGFGKQDEPSQAPDTPLRLEHFPGTLGLYRRPDATDWEAFGKLLDGVLQQVVMHLHNLLAREQRHFGYRVANEIARFVLLAAEQSSGSAESLWTALDLAILEKVLPKFHGTQQELEPLLVTLFEFAVSGTRSTRSAATPPVEADWEIEQGRVVSRGTDGRGAGEQPKLPRTATKVFTMLRRLRRQGFTSFIE